MMFPSGSFTVYFAVFPAVWLWCYQLGKCKMNQNDVPKMFQGGTFAIFLMFSHSVPLLGHFGKTLGTLQQHVWETGKLGTFWMFLRCSWGFPKMSQKRCTVGKHQEHCKCATLEHFQRIILVHFEFSRLGTSQSHHWEHCKVHCDWATREHHGYFLWENSRFTHIT